MKSQNQLPFGPLYCTYPSVKHDKTELAMVKLINWSPS